MTSEMPIKIGRKLFIAKIGGYTGKTETSNPIDDIVDGYMIWLNLAQSRQVPRVGTRVTVTIGGKKFRGKVIAGPGKGRYKYSGSLKKILLSQRIGSKLTRKQITKLHKMAVERGGI